MAHVALGQHEPDAYSAFELDQIQRSKLHGIQQAPASSPRVNLVVFVCPYLFEPQFGPPPGNYAPKLATNGTRFPSANAAGNCFEPGMPERK